MAAARADLGNALINLASGDPDIPTPAHITAAAVAAIDSGEHHVSAAPQNVLIELPPESRKKLGPNTILCLQCNCSTRQRMVCRSCGEVRRTASYSQLPTDFRVAGLNDS